MSTKPHIAIIGRCNIGKSTFMNVLAGEDLSIVSPSAGTTTDPVRRAVELKGVGAVVLVDTGGIDDVTPLGSERRRATLAAMEQCDMGLLVTGAEGIGAPERELMEQARLVELPIVTVVNVRERSVSGAGTFAFDPLHDPIEALCDHITKHLGRATSLSLFGDGISAGDRVVLVCPIDSQAPEGRLILPQVQALRELLDKRAIAHVVQPSQLLSVLDPGVRMVVTDSQAIAGVRRLVPEGVELTTFSILLAGAKGDIALYERGLEALDRLSDGDRVLVMESCLHHVGCDDIGRVKIPRMLERYSGRTLRFDFIGGTQPLPDNLADYVLALQCGGCMVNARSVKARLRRLEREHVPVTNYGMAIRKMSGC